MNLEAIYDLRERLEQAAIAGVKLLPEDFRLQRAVENAALLSKAAPVFRQIEERGRALLSAPEEERADQLLDLLALLSAVLVTQAHSGGEGELSPLPRGQAEEDQEKVPEELYSPPGYRQLSPLLGALTTRGSGRYELLKNARRDSPELFQDYRLRRRLISGLGDSYSEIADMIEGWLKEEGREILPLLKDGFDPESGGKEMLRRFHIIEEIGKEEENPFYLRLVKEAKGELRAEAILALGSSEENFTILKELSMTERGSMRESALKALSNFPASKDYITEIFRKDPKKGIRLIRGSGQNWVSDLLAEEMEEEYQSFSGEGKRGSSEEIRKSNLPSLWTAAVGKESEKLLLQLPRSGSLVPEEREIYLINGLCRNFSPRFSEAVEKLSGSVSEGRSVKYRFLLALREKTAPEIYESFSPYFSGGKGLIGGLKDFFGGGELPEPEDSPIVGIFEALSTLSSRKALRKEKLDPRWYPLLLKYEMPEKYIRYLGEGSHAGYEKILKDLREPSCPERDLLYAGFLFRCIKMRPVQAEDVLSLKEWGWKDFRGVFSGCEARYKKEYSYYQHWCLRTVSEELPLSREELIGELETLYNRAVRFSPGTQGKRLREGIEKLKRGEPLSEM